MPFRPSATAVTALLLCLGLSGASGASAIIADPSAPKNQQPTIVNTASGLPQVNIQTPSAAGVSRNSYKQFDVDSRGVILNNSRTNASTRQGGWVQGNPWLGKGTAKIIVNEVNSNQPSQLRGFVEVAGDRAQVVIANPSGISCAGCGFINADRATLSTGRPLYGVGGGLSGFQVENGLIRVDGAGLDASQTSHTAILARAVEINAGLWAQYLSVVTGQNQVAADGETATASPSAPTGDKPRFALDTARLGGMYAGKIFLIGTEAGVGMRHAGQIGAGPGGFVLRHDGRLELTGGLSSEGDARLASRELDQRGTLYSSGALTVDAGQSLHNSGLLAAHGDVSASAVQLDNRGTLAAGLNGSGDIDRAAALTLSGQTLDLSGGTLHAGGHASLEAGGRIDHRAARLQAGTLRLHAGDAIDNRDGQLAAQQDLVLESGSLDNQKGRIGSLGGLNTRVRGSLDNRSGQLAADGQARVDAGHVDNRSGALGSAHGGLALGADALDNDGGQVLAAGDLSLTLSGDYLHRGELQAGRDLMLASPGTIDNQGRIGAGQTLTLGAATLFNRGSGELVAGGGGRLNLSGELDNAGLIDSADTRITAGSVSNRDRLYGDRVAIQAGSLLNDRDPASATAGVIASRGDMDLGVGTLLNREHALILTEGDLRIGGTLDANGRASGRATRVVNASAAIDVGGNAVLAADELVNRNDHFRTSTVDGATTRQILYRLNGATEFIDASKVRLYNTSYGGGYAGENWRWPDKPSKVLVLPSAKYPFERYGPPFDYNKFSKQIKKRNNGSVAIAFIPEHKDCYTYDGLTDCKPDPIPDEFVYSPSDRIWGIFGIQPPVEPGGEPVDPCRYKGNACRATPGYAQYLTASQTWTTQGKDRKARYLELNQAIAAFNQDLGKRVVKTWSVYIVDRTPHVPVVDSTDPALLRVTGNATLDGRVVNDKSRISVGKTLDVNGPAVENVGATVVQVTTVSGSAQSTYIKTHSMKSDDRRWRSIAYQPGNEESTVELAVARTESNQGTQPRQAETPTQVRLEGVAGRLGNDAIRTRPLPGQVPDSALYQTRPAPEARYLVETDARYASYKTWLSSDYMLQQLKLDPAVTQKRLGDGYYEQRLVNEQVLQLTGRRFLGNYSSNEAQYQALMTAGVEFARHYQLSPGVALSAEQMARLTTDIVWLVAQDVTLADGSRQRVLVPQVYAKVREGDVRGDGTLMAGGDLKLKLAGALDNSGTLLATGQQVIDAGDIRNRGTLMADSLRAEARRDLDNLAGRLSGASVYLAAGNDLNLTSTLRSTSGEQGSRTRIDGVSRIDAGTLLASAGRDLTATAASLHSTGDLTLAAGRDLNLDALTTRREDHVAWDRRNRADTHDSQSVGSELGSGGNLQLLAGRDLGTTAAYLNASGAIGLGAGRDLRLLAGENSASARDERYVASKSLLSGETIHTIDRSDWTEAAATTVSGDRIAIHAGHGLGVTAGNVVATGDLALQAGNQLDIGSRSTEHGEYHFKDVRTTGLGSSGTTFSYGKVRQTDSADDRSQSQSGSRIGSLKGDTSLTAGKALNISGSQLSAGQDLRLQGERVTLVAGENSGQHQETHLFSQTGLNIGISSPLLAALQTTQQMVSAASEVKDPRLAALAAGTVGLAGKNALDAYNADPKAAGGVSLSITFGSSRSESRSVNRYTDAAASTAQAGRDLSIVAVGAGKDSDIVVHGSDVQAGRNATLLADGDIELLAARNTAEQHSSNKSVSGAVGLAITFGSNGAGYGFTASASMARGKSDGNDVIWRNSQLDAGNTLTLASDGDSTLRGADVRGRQVVADIGGDLSIESLQDTSKYKSKQQSASASVTVGVGFSGSVSVGQQKMNSDYASVTEQTGIRAGDGGFQLDVGGHTGLKGGIIASTGQAVQDGANRLTTGTLSYSDIRNHASYSASSVSLGGGYSSKDFSLKPMGGGGDSAAPSSGVGTSQDGTATTGGDKVPGSELPAYNGWSATPPIAMMAKGSGSSTTRSGISGGTLILTDGDPQSLAGLNRNVSTERDSSNTLKPIFDKDKIEAGFAIVEALQRETGTFLNNRAKEADRLEREWEKETDPERKTALDQQRRDAAKWAPGGEYSKWATVLTTATGGNVMGGLGDLAQRAVVSYVQGMGAAQIKELAAQVGDGPQADAARAVLHGLLACGSAAASGGNCGSAALGVAGGVGVNAVLNTLLKDSSTLSAEEKLARENLVGSIVAGIAAETGGDTVSSRNALQIEMENNEWGGLVFKQREYENYSRKHCAGLSQQVCNRKFGEELTANPGARVVLAGLGVLQGGAAVASARTLMALCLSSPVECSELGIAAAEVVGGAGAISGPRGVMGEAAKAAEKNVTGKSIKGSVTVEVPIASALPKDFGESVLGHNTQIGVLNRKAGTISGAHNNDSFLESIEMVGAKISDKITDSRFPGLIDYKYQLPRINNVGELIDGYKTIATKTTYNPKILPDGKVANMSSRAAVNAESAFAANPALREVSIKVDGYYFQVTRNIKTGKITNSFITMPPRIKQ
ncbi:hypothetical protein GCM10027202_24610 [Microvirgula curvata]